MGEKWLHSVAKSGNYNELINKPENIFVNGGNVDTISHKTINDNLTQNNNLWTSQKTNEELETKANKIHKHNTSQIEQDANNRFISDLQLNTLFKVLKWQDVVKTNYLKDVSKSGIYFIPEDLNITDLPVDSKSGTLIVITSDSNSINTNTLQHYNSGIQIFLSNTKMYMRSGEIIDVSKWEWGDWFDISNHGHGIPNASNNSDGLMCASDKIKLDSINSIERHELEPDGWWGNGCYYSKCNNIVHLRLRIEEIQPGEYGFPSLIFTLPEGFRPLGGINKILQLPNPKGIRNVAGVFIHSNGEIYFVCYGLPLVEISINFIAAD